MPPADLPPRSGRGHYWRFGKGRVSAPRTPPTRGRAGRLFCCLGAHMKVTCRYGLTKRCALHDACRMTTTTPLDLVGSRSVCARLAIHRSTLARWVDSGLIAPVGKLDGKNGAYIFTEDEVARLERERAA